MSSEERLAVKDVVMDKISGGEENVPPETERYKCDHCPISFTLLDNLSEHLERKHKLFKTETVITELEEESSPVFIDIKTEFGRKPLTSPDRKKSKINLKASAKRKSYSGWTKHGGRGREDLSPLF